MNTEERDRCMAMKAREPNAGDRCKYARVPGEKLCKRHLREGAVIPDGWTPTGLPVFRLPLTVNA